MRLMWMILAVFPAHDGPQIKTPTVVQPEVEAAIHTPVGFDKAGEPAVVEGGESSRLGLRIVDADSRELIPCRVNVVGSDGNYYEPLHNRLRPWSLHRTGNRQGKGPHRYYGWFFFTTGHCDVSVPAGKTMVEVWRGFEYQPARVVVDLEASQTVDVVVPLDRTLDMNQRAWYSGDTHLHFDRQTAEQSERIVDLIAAEDINVGFVLAMNDPGSYVGRMRDQIWPQDRGMGIASLTRRGRYMITSGQEYRCKTFGHICLLLGDELVLRGRVVDPNNWPTFGEIVDLTHALRGYAVHAHGGYSQEIYADFAQRKGDAVELMQFARYRGIALEGWYHMLNIGFRLPAVGACDYPYCRALGDSRTYAQVDGELTPETWMRAVKQGRSFQTSGPMLLVNVSGRSPGDTIAISGESTLKVDIEVLAEVGKVQHVDVIANGELAERFDVTPPAEGTQREVISTHLTVSESTWIAVRAWGTGIADLHDGDAHTNPVYIIRDGRGAYRNDSVVWLLERLEEQKQEHATREFKEQPDVLRYFDRSVRILQTIKANGGQSDVDP